MVGRPHHNFWKRGHFGMIRKANGRLCAKCMLCSRELSNTSRTRLLLHRKSCKPVNEPDAFLEAEAEMLAIHSKKTLKSETHAGTKSTESANDPEGDTSTHEMNCFDIHLKHENESDCEEDTQSVFQVYIDHVTEEYIISSSPSNDDLTKSECPTIDVKNNEEKVITNNSVSINSRNNDSNIKLNTSNIKPAITSSKETNLEEIHLAFSEFFISSHVPFKTLKSKYLQQFLLKLNVPYTPPNLSDLTTKYVGQICEKYKPKMPDQEKGGILLLTGWNSTTNSSKCIVACLYMKGPNESEGSRVFLNLWDLDALIISAEDEMQIKIIQESRELARNLYNTDVYAIISDNPQLHADSFDVPLWHFVCHSYLAGCLANCIINQDDSHLVKKLLLEFQREEIEKQLLEQGGVRVLLPTEKCWCTYRDSFKSFLDNYEIIRGLVTDENYEMHPTIRDCVFNNEFVEKIKTYYEILKPLCNLIYTSQKQTTSLADIAEEWLQLTFPPEYASHLERKRNEALTPFAMAANFFHPVYLGRRLNEEHKIIIEYFLVECLDSSGLDQLILFKRNEGIFRMLATKKMKSYDTYWSIAEQICPELAVLAKKLLCIQSSISYIDKLLTSWSTTHAMTRNLLGIDRYKKMTEAYFALNLCHK